jgi:hypothetical protein
MCRQVVRAEISLDFNDASDTDLITQPVHQHHAEQILRDFDGRTCVKAAALLAQSAQNLLRIRLGLDVDAGFSLAGLMRRGNAARRERLKSYPELPPTAWPTSGFGWELVLPAIYPMRTSEAGPVDTGRSGVAAFDWFSHAPAFVVTFRFGSSTSSFRITMKKMLHFFSRPGEEKYDGTTTYLFREPTLDPLSERAAPARQPVPADPAPRETRPAESRMPADYAGIVAFFEKTVLERKSPYSALVKAADRLQEYIPNEINRLKAAYTLCGEQWSPDVLSFAISTHIADIDHAREKARGNRDDVASENAGELRAEAERLQQENAAIQDEMRELNASLARLESTLHANQAGIDSLNDQIQRAQNEANSMCFVDQAAENIKNDLLAKKVILGLP